MANLRSGILLSRYALQAFRPTMTNSSHASLGLNSSIKLILTQSRCLYIKKSIMDLETKDVQNPQHDSIKKDYLLEKRDTKVNETMHDYNSITDVQEKIRASPLNSSSIKYHLYGMLNVHKLHKSSPEFAAEADVFLMSDEFQRLAQTLEKTLPMSSAKSLYVIFQVMHIYGIPVLSILMQKLHALILDNINNFELTEVLKMYLIIKEKDDDTLNPVKKAFLEYMTHLTSDNLEFLGDIRSLAYFASKSEVPFSVRLKILKKILLLGKQLKELDPLLLKWLSFPLCSPEFESLRKWDFIFALKERIPTDFAYRDLKTVLKNLTIGLFNSTLNYDRQLFLLIAERARKYGLWAANDIMAGLVDSSFELARTIEKKCTEANLNSQPMQRIAKLISNFASIDYGSYAKKNNHEEWETVTAKLQNYLDEELLSENISTALCLFHLGLNSEKTASTALKQFAEYLKYQPKATRITAKRAYLLYQYHCLVYKSPPENLPENFLSHCFSAEKKEHSTAWKKNLYQYFNGEEYVLHNCITPLGTLVSHIVILGPDKKPINLSSYKIPQQTDSVSIKDFVKINKIERPANSKVLVFIEVLKSRVYFRSTKNLRMEYLIPVKLHENLGYKFIYLFSSSGNGTIANERLHNLLSWETKELSTADQSYL